MNVMLSFGQQLRVRRNYILDLRNEITEAGNDYIGTYTSDPDESEARVRQVNGFNDWEVLVRYEIQTVWDNSYQIEIQRTNDGTGNGTIMDGNAFQIVTELDAPFFSGTLNRNGINIQYRVSGISVQIPVDNYRASIIFTLIAN